MRHGEMNEGNTGFWVQFVIFRQPTTTPDPGKRTLYHPTTGQEDKTFGIVTAFDDLHFPIALLLDPSEEFTGVPAIGPDEFKAGKALFAPGEH